MDTIAHLRNLRAKLNGVFDQTIALATDFNKSHYFSSCLFDFAQHLDDVGEREILTSVSAQIQGATLTAAFGLYRQAFSSLRLALEMGLSAAYFSVHRLELSEWQDGREDINWHRLIDDQKGVLSTRFANAFFPELSSQVTDQKKKATELYRQLSEFVHGNHETWERSGLAIEYSENLHKLYEAQCAKVFEVVMFVLCCRHLKSFTTEAIEDLSFINEEFSHLGAIRVMFGGPKDI